MAHRTGDAEADVVDPEGGMTPAPYRGPAAPVLVEPATAAEHSVGAVCLGVVDVPAPLPDVAQHVEQPPGVGLLAAHRVQSSLRVAAVPRDIVELPMPRCAGPGAAGVFPLGLSRKPIAIGGRVPFNALAVGIEPVGGDQLLLLGKRMAEPHRVPPRNPSTGSRSPRAVLGHSPVTCAYCAWVTGKADIWCAATSTAQLRRDRRSVSTTLPAGTGTIALSAPVLMRWGRYRHLRRRRPGWASQPSGCRAGRRLGLFGMVACSRRRPRGIRDVTGASPAFQPRHVSSRRTVIGTRRPMRASRRGSLSGDGGLRPPTCP